MEDKSTEIANMITSMLEKYGEGLTPTPVMYNPVTMSPTVGILVETDEGQRLAYNISVNSLIPKETKE